MKDIPLKTIASGIIGFFALLLLWSSWYTIPEGHVGIVKTFSKASGQVEAGLNFKRPFMDTVEEIEIRTRKNEENMTSSTSEQMPVTIMVSVNWTVEKTAALALFKEYGGLTQFENRILDPRFRSATKDIIPKFTAEQLIQDRSTAIMRIEALLIEEMAPFPVKVDNIQIENINLPPKYLQSIETKQTAKNLADAEQFNLDKQALVAQQAVNTSRAQADGIALVAEAEANAIRLKGLAEAEAIEAKAKALENNPLIVDLTEAQTWNGQLPQTVMGEGAMPIMDMRKKN